MRVVDLTPEQKRNFERAWSEVAGQNPDGYRNKKEMGCRFFELLDMAMQNRRLDTVIDFLQSQTGIKIL